MATHSLSLGPTKPLSQIVDNDITWDLSAPLEVGRHLDGSYYIVLPSGTVDITQTPAWDTDKNGAMIDPMILVGGNPVHGFDSRVNATSLNGPGMDLGSSIFYQASARASLTGIAASATPRSIISAKSAASVQLGGMSNGMESMSVLTVYQSAPSRPRFRPPWAGTTKPTFTRADVNFSLLPGLSASGITPPDWTTAAYLKRPRIDMGSSAWGRTIFPTDSGDAYPAYDALYSGEVAVGCLLDIPEAEELAMRLIQYGIDMYYAALLNDTTFVANGGFGWGRLWPIVFAGIMLNHSGMKNAAALTTTFQGVTVYKFGECGHCYYGQATGGYPGGKPLWGRAGTASDLSNLYANHDYRDPDGLVEPHELPSHSSTLRAGSTTTDVVLATSASDVDDAYTGYIYAQGGTTRVISDYVGSTRVATLSTALGGAPSAGTSYQIRLGGTYQEMSNFVTGHALACRMMGAEATLGYNAFLDFFDRWVDESGLLNNSPYSPTWADPIRPYGSAFIKAAWEAHR